MKSNESELIIRLVNDFAKRSLLPMIERHDIYIQPDQLNILTQRAEEIGLLNFGKEKGAGLWEEIEGEYSPKLSMLILATLAEYNAGVAWHFHQSAFGYWMVHRLGIHNMINGGVILANLQGKYGLARTALPKFLLGSELNENDRTMLTDYFISQNDDLGIVINAADHWDRLLFPFFNQDRIDWCYLPREDLAIEYHERSHGLDEISCISIKPRGKIDPIISLDIDESRRIYAEALQINALALIAISLGAVKHGYRLASEYAAIRRQGGKMINQHPVVQELLADIRSTIDICILSLNDLTKFPISLERTDTILGVRSKLSPLLSKAATNAVQTMGGIGYMRDTGVEKILRDVNHLRLTNGTPLELALFAAEWERLR